MLRAWTIRGAALGVAAAVLVLALTIRALSDGPLQQHSGTALYASMIYAGVLVLWPRMSPVVAGVAATAFCWLVELSQLTGVPAALSERSLLARLVLGVQFDVTDLLWYPVGVLPLVLLDRWAVARRRRPPVAAAPRP